MVGGGTSLRLIAGGEHNESTNSEGCDGFPPGTLFVLRWKRSPTIQTQHYMYTVSWGQPVCVDTCIDWLTLGVNYPVEFVESSEDTRRCILGV